MFANQLDDMILSRLVGREGIASIYRYLNVVGAQIEGGLVAVETAISRAFEAHASYQFLDTRDASTGLPLEYSTRHRASVGASYSSRSRGLLVSAFGNLTGRTYFGLVNGKPDYMRSFELFGVNLQKDIRRDLALRLTFRNLSDNVDPLYRFTAPFSIEASVRIRLGAGR